MNDLKTREYGNRVWLTLDPEEATWDDWNTVASILTYNVSMTEKALALGKDIPFGFYKFDKVEYFCTKDPETGDLVAVWYALGA